MDDEEIRRKAEALRARGQQAQSARDAQKAAVDRAAAEFRQGVRDFAETAAQRLRAAGVPTREALLGPVEPAQQGRPSWQRPTWRERFADFKDALNGMAPTPEPTPPSTVAGWQIPILHPLTGDRAEHGVMFEITRYDRGDVSSRATWFLIVFLTVDGRLCFAAQPMGDRPPLLYDFDRDSHWVREFAGKEIASLDRGEVTNALGFLRDSEREWQVGREQAQISLWETKEHNDQVVDGLLVGWHAGLEDLLQPR
ncbi:hypothetical protein [Streptomyces sp. NPDC096132]|uniref:hypothetical protein n=1 Tax=Streptomyces sp. NPDC096132 TaxID=3366075 RepID=UPI003809F01E